MNYIIINGKNSHQVNGLMILNLPPITKPGIRYKKTEIDGVDGDLIEKLGYQSYDKSFDIGLVRDYDVDEISEFFKEEGTVTFSNEQDKYYKYKLLTPINYEKLITLKKAKVTLHVEPFKYSNVEGKQTFKNIQNKVTIRNNGNTFSKPIFWLYGANTISLSIGNKNPFRIENLEGCVAIDTEKMEVYEPVSGVLMNRVSFGSFEDLYLDVGKNEVTVTGNVTKIEIENKSRWL